MSRRWSKTDESGRVEMSEGEAFLVRSVARLAAAAAHEINNPLTVIVGGLELLVLNADLDEHSRTWVSRALDAAHDIHETVRRMGRITRLEAITEPESLPEMLDLRRSSEEVDVSAA
jgi:signal transduction histidine kinase